MLNKIKINEKNKSSFIKNKINKEKENRGLYPEGQLAVDVYETNSDFVIVTAIAGVSSKEIDIFVEKDMLIIKGERPNPEGSLEKKNYFYQECYWGPFSRKILLPEDVDSSQIKAEMEKGVLVIKIPRIQKTEKRKVQIQE